VSIRFSKYVQITSGVGGASVVRERALIGRLFSTALFLSPLSVFEFTDAASVGEFFGTSSGEYARAAAYFSYVSPGAFNTPRRISFARYAPTGTGAQVYGDAPSALSQLALASAGSLRLVFDDTNDVDVLGVDLSGVASFSGVATELTSAIQVASVDPNVSGATVAYDAVNARFVLSTNNIADVAIRVEALTTGVNDLASALAWTSATPGTLYVHGIAPQTPADAFTQAENVSNNFGSFAFLPALTLEQHATLAELNAGRNVAYMYLVGATRANAASWAAALAGFAGCGVTLSPVSTRFPELFPMVQLAATDYTQRNATSTYMFKQWGGLVPDVTTDEESDALDALRVNYYGQTQTAGQTLNFYQRGLLMGGPTAPVDMSVYANEQWLKSRVEARFMDLLLSSNRVPANASGRGQILAVVQDAVNDALVNGVISVGKTLSTLQRADVTQRTGDPLAFYQVQTTGYWVDATVVPYVGPGGTTEYKAVYSLIYAKDDAVRLIQGTHTLI
jgi:Protein of unknown function (DUF3383)